MPWVVAVLALVVWPAVSRAQPAPAEVPPAPPSAAVTAPLAEADREYTAGLAAFRRGAFEEAALHFGAAYNAVPHPFALYNMGRSYEGGGQVALAIEAYDRYLGEAPAAPDAGDVRERLRALRTRPVDVFVSSEPAGATLRVDHGTEPAGTTPVVLHLVPGPHALELDHPGYRRAADVVLVAPGVTHSPLQFTLEAVVPPRVQPDETMYDRILARRPRRVNYRVAALAGVAWPRDRFNPAVGVEATVFWRRSLAAQVHFLQIETDGSPMILTGELGWVFPLDDLDLGIFAHAGAVFGCDIACRDASPTGQGTQFLAGLTFRADVVLLPRLGVGLFGRFSWRHLDITDSASLLSSLGLSISFLL